MGSAPVERSLSTLADYRERALELIPAQSVASVIGVPGSDVFETDERNREGWSRLALVPHVLVDVRDRATATTVLGQAVSSPVLLSPVGSHNRAHPDGERATARAAERTGTVMGLSTVLSYTIEEVAASSQAALWFQLYVFRERSISAVLAKRAVDAGYKAIVLTVDNPGTRSDERVFGHNASKLSTRSSRTYEVSQRRSISAHCSSTGASMIRCRGPTWSGCVA